MQLTVKGEDSRVLLKSSIIISRTVVPAKSDSDVMFVYKVIRDLESIDHLCINPIRRILIGLILK